MVQAYSSLGSPDSQGVLLQHQTVLEWAKRLDCTPAQLLLLWALEQSIPVIPKSIDEKHIQENLNTILRRCDYVIDENEWTAEDEQLVAEQSTEADSVTLSARYSNSRVLPMILSLNQLDEGKGFCWDPSIIK